MGLVDNKKYVISSLILLMQERVGEEIKVGWLFSELWEGKQFSGEGISKIWTIKRMIFLKNKMGPLLLQSEKQYQSLRDLQ